MNSQAELLKKLWWAGVNAVRGFEAVQSALSDEAPNFIIAIGKAASDMALGARAKFDAPIPTIVATKYDHASDALRRLEKCQIIEAAHPVPDENSLAAGTIVLDAVKAMGKDERLLLLVSGGASSLVEVLQPSMTLDGLIAANKGFLAQGLDIHAINAERKKLSQIKAGQLLQNFSGTSAHVIAISDVEGDSIDVIGSGIGAYDGANPNIKITIAGSNKVARQEIANAAKAQNVSIITNEESLYGNVDTAAARIIGIIEKGPKGLYVFGGEPTIQLPQNPGRGGRNQHLALLLADKIKGHSDCTILVAGTDGTDGPTGDAGGLIDGHTVQDNIQSYFNNADTGSYLAKRDALFTTGPTGTNVMDIVLVLKT